MTRIEFWEPAGTFDVPGKGEFPQKFASGAFEGTIGKRVPMRAPSGRQAGWCTVVSVVVDSDGGGATWTVDIEGDFPVAEAAYRTAGMSFAFREPDPVELSRDPLKPGELKIRWRGSEPS